MQNPIITWEKEIHADRKLICWGEVCMLDFSVEGLVVRKTSPCSFMGIDSGMMRTTS